MNEVEPSASALEFADGWEAYGDAEELNSRWSKDERDGWKAAQREKWTPKDQESGLEEDTGIHFEK